MKRIKFPSGKPVAGVDLTCCDILTQFVLVTPFWKTGSMLKRVEANISITDELLKNPLEPVISDDEHGILVEAMSLQNGAVQVSEPKVNHLYMLTFKAVLRAEDELEVRPKE